MLKYRGGKFADIKYFKEHFPRNFDTFLEPFVGGGAVYFYLEHKKSIINDINEKLITFYLQLQNNYQEVRRQLDELQGIYDINQSAYEALKKKAGKNERVENKNENLYYELRDKFNNPDNKWLEAVLYFFINKTAYSGMIRYNKNGFYNVPYGRYKNFNTKIITEKHHELLKRTYIYKTDFAEIFKMANEDDFIFLDPPYHKAIFNDYGNPEHENGFSEAEHLRLADEYKKLKCKALMVISKTELTEKLYGDYVVGEYGKSYAVNIRNRFKNVAEHIIVKNY